MFKNDHASILGFLGGSVVKNLPASSGEVRDAVSIPVLERFPGVGNGSLLLYSCLENSMDREAWQATVGELRVRHDLVGKAEKSRF